MIARFEIVFGITSGREGAVLLNGNGSSSEKRNRERHNRYQLTGSHNS
jgi:hypothetical protein